jgi:hypothetical protein
VASFFWQHLLNRLTQNGFSPQQVLAPERKETIPINTLGIPSKNFVREKGGMFGTK